LLVRGATGAANDVGVITMAVKGLRAFLGHFRKS